MADETAAQTIRRIVRAVPRGALGTVLRQSGGAPYVSLVSLATDHDGAPLLLLSELAQHTRNLRENPRVSLLLDATEGREDPLAGERVTLQGTIEPTSEPRHRARYLARHPSASLYAGFQDFAFYRMALERAHLVAGFGRIHWVAAAGVLIEPQPALVEREADILEHMNAEHRDAVQLYARELLGLPGSEWQLTGLDPEGCDLRHGARTARLGFAREIRDAETARAELVRLARQARTRRAQA